MKEYFAHDYSARHDRKIAALIEKYKSSGYGIFWATCEMMHEEGGELELDEITYGAISKNVNEDKILLKNVISDCIEIFKLFVLFDGKLTSNRVKKNLDKRLNLSDIRSKAGKAGAKAKQKLSKAKQMTYIKGKENKGKENKGKESDFINPLHEIYTKSWAEYASILNGQSDKLNEEKFLFWKEFVDFIYENDFTDLFCAKFVSPIDFDKLVMNGFTKDKWDIVLRKILSTGIKPEHNLFFRIPDFIDYSFKNGGKAEEMSEYEKKLKAERDKYKLKNSN